LKILHHGVILSPLFLNSGPSIVGRAVDQAVVIITEYKEMDSKPYKALLLQVALKTDFK
jgi:hypothetical protein